MSLNAKLDAEVKLLASAYANSAPPDYRGFSLIESHINPHVIQDSSCRALFGAMAVAASSSRSFDPRTLLKLTGSPSDTNLQERMGQVVNLSLTDHARSDLIDNHIKTLRATFLPSAFSSRLRQAMAHADAGGDIESIFAELDQSVRLDISRVNDVPGRNMRSVGDRLMEQLDGVWSGRIKQKPFIPTKFSKLNTLLGGGWYRGSNVIAARPSVGKTAMWEDDVIWQASDRGIGSILVSLEMTAEDHLLRMAIRHSMIGKPYNEIWQEGFSARERLADSVRFIQSLPIVFACLPGERGLGQILKQVRATVRTWEYDEKPEIVAVDYGQLMTDESRQRGRVEDIGHCTLAVKDYCADEGKALLLCAQLNRGKETEKREPLLSDLKGCGDIEQDAWTATFPDRDLTAYVPGQPQPAKFYVRKSRSGYCGEVDAFWIGEQIRYVEDDGSIRLDENPYRAEHVGDEQRVRMAVSDGY